MRNSGDTAWPVGTQLVQSSGDRLQPTLVSLKEEVAPGETYEFVVQMKAPKDEGRYIACFRLQTATKNRFGQKITCDILSVRPGSELLAPVQKPGKAVVVRKPKAAANRSDTPEPYMKVKSPKELYFKRVQFEDDDALREALTTLYDAGFVDFDVNLKLMLRVKDINKAVDILLSWGAKKNDPSLEFF